MSDASAPKKPAPLAAKIMAGIVAGVVLLATVAPVLLGLVYMSLLVSAHLVRLIGGLFGG